MRERKAAKFRLEFVRGFVHAITDNTQIGRYLLFRQVENVHKEARKRCLCLAIGSLSVRRFRALYDFHCFFVSLDTRQSAETTDRQGDIFNCACAHELCKRIRDSIAIHGKLNANRRQVKRLAKIRQTVKNGRGLCFVRVVRGKADIRGVCKPDCHCLFRGVNSGFTALNVRLLRGGLFVKRRKFRLIGLFGFLFVRRACINLCHHGIEVFAVFGVLVFHVYVFHDIHLFHKIRYSIVNVHSVRLTVLSSGRPICFPSGQPFFRPVVRSSAALVVPCKTFPPYRRNYITKTITNQVYSCNFCYHLITV